MDDRPASLRAALRDPWALLIALGLYCQGFSYESDIIREGFQPGDYIMPVVYLVLWACAVEFGSTRVRISKSVESIIVALCILAAFQFGESFGYNKLVFIGNGLLALQLLYLFRPTSVREKKWATGVSIVHLAIGSQLITGYGFIPVLVGIIVLLPLTLFHLEATRYRKYATTANNGPRARDYAAIFVLMIVFFVAIPQPEIRSMTHNSMMNLGGRGPMDDQIDADATARDTDDTLLFRIEGDNLQYLRLFVLNEFNGRTWSMNEWARQRKPDSHFGTVVQRDEALPRTVNILAPALMPRHFVPSDGAVQDWDGLPTGTYRLESGAIGLIRPMGDTSYRYWTITSDPSETLRPRDFQEYTSLDAAMSPELYAEVERVVDGEEDAMRIANRLTGYLRDNFTYALGVPRLDEEAPVEDFVLNAREGHCERFASALAVMLRMKGIPSRVVMGYTASERNRLGGYYNVRTRHGHAWTEAWIQGRGWVLLDATPVGGGSIPLEPSPLLSSTWDWVQYMWYGKVVEFDSTAQTALWESIGSIFGRASGMVLDNMSTTMLGIILLAGLLGMRRLPWGRWLRRRRRDRVTQIRAAQTFYTRMLKTLARDQYERPPGMTPLEFQAWLARHQHPAMDDVRLITDTFCHVRYGEGELEPERERQVDAALHRLRGARHPRPPARA